MPIVVVSGGDECPATTRQGSEHTHAGDQCGEPGAGPSRDEIPEPDEGEARACGG